MIEWQEHSTPHERTRLADELDRALEAVHELQRQEQRAQTKLARQKKPESVVKATAELDAIQRQLAAARTAHAKAVRTMCEVHVDISLDDIVELADANGNRKREPIIVENVEFNREANGDFWMRIQGVLLRESDTGRPQLRQGFDLYEHDPDTRLVKQN